VSISVEHAAATVTTAVGQTTTQIDQVHGSVANQDFIATLADGRKLVLKFGPEHEILAEAWACRRLRSLDVPVPQVIVLDLGGADLGYPYLILSFVDGCPSEHPAVVGEAGAWLRQVHGIELSGWGPLVVEPDTGAARGRYQSWREAVRAELSGLRDLVAAGILAPDLAAAASALVEVQELLGYSGPGVLLHNDLKPEHIFGLDDGRTVGLTAIIDWGDARVGDPVADLARLSMAGSDVTAAFLDGYGIAVDTDLHDRFARYRLCWNVGALSYEYRAGGDWFDVYRARIIDDVTSMAR
jgi:aminoglycoside phosphotransferase (APT) family kinase protein